MSCPHLAFVTMSFCRAYPVKKLVPAEGASLASTCAGDGYESCPAFEDASRRPAALARSADSSSRDVPPKGGRS